MLNGNSTLVNYRFWSGPGVCEMMDFFCIKTDVVWTFYEGHITGARESLY